MSIVFADTVFYVAALNRRDELHDNARQFVRGFRGRSVTTEYVLLEVANWQAGFTILLKK